MRRRSMSQPLEMSDLNIVLLGMTGSGKSASGNTILGGERNTFSESETRICKAAHKVVDGQTITVIDTVRLSDTSVKITELKNKIKQIFDCTSHGVDVFLLVIKLGETFTAENSEVVKWIQEKFGKKVLKHMIALFTHGDQLHGTLERYLSERETLRSVVDQCSGGFHVFKNKDEDQYQVNELLKKINKLREKNGHRRYTAQDYKETQNTSVTIKYGTVVVRVAAAAIIIRAAKIRAATTLIGAIGCAVYFFVLKKKKKNVKGTR